MESIVVLAGGVGGGRFSRGLLHHLKQRSIDAEVTVVVNTGDDMWLNGLRVCPDLDTVMYTLGGGINEEQGWGRPDESSRTATEIAAYGRGWPWFTLGDLDLATHIVRTDLLRTGHTLSEATATLCERWQPGARLLPMTNHEVETHVRLADAVDDHRPGDLIHFEQWWVRYRALSRVREFVRPEVEQAEAAPGVLEAILDADLVILAPSNPVVSVGSILAVPGVRDAVHRTPAAVVGVSPLIGGAAVRGMAGQCLDVIGVETSAAGVGLHYGARANGGLLDAWLVDEVDSAAIAPLTAAGIRTAAVPLWMNDVPTAADIAAEAVAISGV